MWSVVFNVTCDNHVKNMKYTIWNKNLCALFNTGDFTHTQYLLSCVDDTMVVFLIKFCEILSWVEQIFNSDICFILQDERGYQY